MKKIIVCLDQSGMDETLIKFASFISGINQIRKVYFTNIIRNLTIPKEVLKEFPSLIETMVEERKNLMKKKVEAHFDRDLPTEFSFIVKDGQLSKKILKLAHDKSVDMILIGRKVTIPGTGVLSQRLARRACCSLLIVPEQSSPGFKKLLVPSDFSDYSKEALEEAIAIAEKNPGKVDIICQNVFTIPSGYHITGKSYEEFATIMQSHAEVNYKKFIRKIETKNIPITPIYTIDKDDDPTEDIIKKAIEIKADMIIIGAKGRTAATALFIGSMAERLIQLNDKLPLLVTRPKGKHAGILEYILEI